MSYVDGFVIPIAKRNLPAYRRLAQQAGKIWMEHGALQYVECVGEDLSPEAGKVLTFPKLAKAKPNETVLFSYIVYKNRKHRDAVNKKVMADPRIANMKGPMPFDPKRMAYGGFTTIVER